MVDGIDTSSVSNKVYKTYHVGHGGDDLAACGLGDALQVGGEDSPHGDGARLDEVLEAEVVDALGREDHTRTWEDGQGEEQARGSVKYA